MTKFKVDESFWEIFPEAEIGVVVFQNTDNRSEEYNEEIQMYLREAEKEALQHLTSDDFAKNEIIENWRNAFTKFKKKKGVRASIEALLKRVSKGDEIGSISPLVDIYNGVSLKLGIPIGAEDIDSFKGDLRLTVTSGGDNFITLGSDKSEPTLEGEVCYLDDEGAVCRCWNWRESVRTMLKPESENIVFILESLGSDDGSNLRSAIDELATTIRSTLGGVLFQKTVLTKENSCIELD